jgi:hypothetical protein
MTPTIYKRSIDTRFRCVVRTAAGQPCHRGTQCRSEASAKVYAELLQRDVARRAETGDMLPPPALRPRSRKPC